jgi:hypothetical protein
MFESRSKSSLVGVVLLVLVLVSGFLWGVAATEQRVERAVRYNTTATALLSKLQLEGEKLRRYEKEMFIYIAVPDKRNNYIKEFGTAYGRLLDLTNEMLAPSSPVFSDEEREQVLRWKLAAVFYESEFGGLVRRAQDLNLGNLTPEQRLGLTVAFNEGIKAGKDRFRDLLSGTEKMRADKEARSLALADELNGIFLNLRIGVSIGGLVVIAGLLLPLLRRSLPGAGVGVGVGAMRTMR